MKRSLLFKFVLLIVTFVGFSAVSKAQVTTSSMTGTIKDAKGTLPGATVKATHTPTGTVYTVSTNNDGRFTIGGMRVGGPYTIEINFIGYQPQKLTDVYLKLGEPYQVNVVLNDNSSTLAEVKVIGQSNSILNSKKTGTSTVIGQAQIERLPTISRSVNDITRLTPQSNGTGIGGGNYRGNNFTVDGANFNNQFGIGQNIPANGSPISLDALEQISINVTPYDVRQTGFTGGAVSAVTRSGGNKFFGGAFYTMRGDDQQGKRIGDVRLTNVQPLDEKNYGFNLGGPIVKDKLFFFVDYEKKKTTAPGNNRIAATPANPYGNLSNVAPASADFLNSVKSYLLSKYNYDPGVYQGYSNISDNEKIFARLDWNISKSQRFSVRYNQVESQSPSSASTSTSGSGVTGVYGYGNSRSGSNQDAGLNFSNSNYFQASNLYTGVAELNSSFGSKITNVLRATYAHQNDPRTSTSAVFPLVDILDGTQSASSAGKVLTTFGYEPFTFGNLRDVTTYTYSDDLSLALGKHNVTFGLQAEYSTTKNGFQRFGTGFYTFANFDDFKNGANPLQYSITYSENADGSQAFPSFKFAQYSAYLQDEYAVSDRFKLTAGLRVEQPRYPDVSEIKTHELVLAQTFANGTKINTGELPQNRISYSPRFGFNWDVIGDRSLQIRGGSGIFTGRIPFVWIVAQSGDAGLLQYTQAYSGPNNVPGPFNPDVNAYIPSPKATPGTTIPGNISSNSKSLRFPQTWKSSLAFDVKLPYGIVGTIEGIYGKDLYAATAQNVNLVDPTPLNIPGYPDNRPFYPYTSAGKTGDRQVVRISGSGLPDPNGTSTLNVTQLTNSKGGYNWQATAQLSKQFNKGVSLMVAYTHSEQRNFGDGAGDQLINLWSIPETSGNPNSPTLSYSSNLNPDRVIASLSYRKEFLKNLATNISVFYEGTQQGRFSYDYSGDFNRDGQRNDLIYIPKDPSEIIFSPITKKNGTVTTTVFTSQQQSDAFFAYVKQDKYLSKHQGEYAKRNGALLPWRNQVDFRLSQEVFKNIGSTKNSVEFSVDIFNLGNLFNRNWGNVNYVNNSLILSPTNVSNINNTTKPTFNLATTGGQLITDSFGVAQTISSTYYMQFGIRYKFN
ncbi:outer membrane receptor protein involved in Fe transport [Pedobacter sp. UYEF25]